MRILFVLATLAPDATTDLCRTVQELDATRYAIDVVSCVHGEGAAEAMAVRIEGVGVPVDRTPWHLSFDDTVAYLAGLIPGYEAVVSRQDVADVYPALDRLHKRPPLIEFGTTVAEALSGPKHFTTRYVGASTAVRDAAARRMPGRERDAVTIEQAPGAARSWAPLFDAVRIPNGAPSPRLFRSVFHGGFECSTHRRPHDRARVDVIAATRHDAFAQGDYRALADHGIRTVRDGVRWHLVEATPGRYDWSSLESQLDGASTTGTQMIWDLLHYGWPDHVDVWGPDFVPHFARFAAAAARTIRERTTATRFYCPVNEISFLSWGGGDVACLNPFARGRGFELKIQLARAAIAATEAILADDPDARFVHVDPVINIVADPARPWDAPHAQGHRQAQFHGWDLIGGRLWPQIGGRPELLDIIGVNYYCQNQWIHNGAPIDRDHPLHKPFHRILAETYARYGRPIFVAETGIEGDARAGWLAHVADEVREARRLGVPVEGICLYPILDHPGWDDERPCPNGLLHTLPGTDTGARQADPAYAAELARQQATFDRPIRSMTA